MRTPRPALALALFALLPLVSACGGKTYAAGADSPKTAGFHMEKGNRLLEDGKPEAAREQFALAARLSPKNSSAQVGLALVAALAGDCPGALELLQTAKKTANTKARRAEAAVAAIRVHTLGKSLSTEKWLGKAVENFEEAERLDPKNPAPHLAMARAYREVFDLAKAEERTTKALELDKTGKSKASEELAELRIIQKAAPKSELGRKIALMREATRADVAALLVHEVEIETLLSAKGAGDSGGKTLIGKYPKSPKAWDAARHLLQNEIQAVLRLGVAGLGLYPDTTFKPDLPVQRAVLAMALYDVLYRVTGESPLGPAAGRALADVPQNAPYREAAEVCLELGFLAPGNAKAGRFAPAGVVTGAEAVLAARRLAEAVKKGG
jgi:Tfp pilus assembly protein PilF